MPSLFKKVWNRLRKAAHQTNRLLYVVGIQTVRIIRRTGRRIRRFFRPLGGFVRNIVRNQIGRRILWVWTEILYLFTHTRSTLKKLRYLKKAPKTPSAEIVRQHRKQLWRHIRSLVGTAVNVVAPILALIILVQTIHYWTSQSYALALEYDGHYIGLVENEAAVDDLISMVSTRLQGGNAENAENVTPTYNLTPISAEDHFTPTNTLCDTILVRTSSNKLEEAYGLYVDGEFIAAIRSETDLRFILQTILKSYESDDNTATAAFIEDVQIVKGIYTSISILESNEMQWLLTSPRKVQQTYIVRAGDTPSAIAQKLGMTMTQLRNLNPDVDLDNGGLQIGDRLIVSGEKGFFSIKMQKKVTYTKSIGYKTVTEQSADLYVGTSKVVTQGANGTQQVVDLITYIDGVEVARENVSTTVIQAPVDKVVQVGTKKKPTVASVSTGTMMWPVPSTKRISDGFGYVGGRYHGAIDIMCSYERVVAADGGKVIQAGWHYGYGWCVLIQHSNGLETFYAHMSKLNVSTGQVISKGTTVGTSGNTGSWSMGAHLHFEVHKNGVKVNPLKYVKR